MRAHNVRGLSGTAFRAEADILIFEGVVRTALAGLGPGMSHMIYHRLNIVPQKPFLGNIQPKEKPRGGAFTKGTGKQEGYTDWVMGACSGAIT